ncbi:MAG: hypothetical protein EA378_07350 [Phycisphaerales bacterium]|nr:MAG: hypothetical protein EA378_07350 [Phycisphaerales bacterium]
MRTQTLALINLLVFSLFMCIAGLGSLVPAMVKDRVPDQFTPLWRTILGSNHEDQWQRLPDILAVISQWVIGLAELAIGVVAAIAVVRPKHRLRLASLSLSGAAALFGTFMVVLFFLHAKELPQWNQYPAILVWIAAMWLLLAHADPESARIRG